MATYNSDKWHEWMVLAQKGDQASYRLLLTELQPWLRAFYSKRIHQNIVDDLVQDTLLTIHAKRQTFDPTYPFGAWISAVARHRWIDYMRKNLKYVQCELDESMICEASNADITARHDVEKLLKTIPSAQAEVIDMIKIRDFSVEEAAIKTGRSVSSIKVMVHRGLKKLNMTVGAKNDQPID